MSNLTKFLKEHCFEKRFKYLIKKLKNKKVLIYGTGKLFKLVAENYDLSSLDIIGLCDNKYLIDEFGQIEQNYKIIPKSFINDIDFDAILICAQEYQSILSRFKKSFKHKLILPLVPLTFKEKICKFVNNKILYKSNNTFVFVKTNGKRIYNPKIKNLKIEYRGKNNYIEIHEPYWPTREVCIVCESNNRLIIHPHNRQTFASISLEGNNELIIGASTTMANVRLWLPNSPNTKIIIGKDCMFSYDIEFRTGDGHTVYDINTHEALNPSEDIIIGNHVWIGRGSTILKGANIPSNCIVGANSTVNKKFNKENCIIAGLPAKIIKENINWDRRAPHNFYH